MSTSTPDLMWEPLSVAHGTSKGGAPPEEFLSLAMYRAKVPGGWLLMAKVTHGVSVSFYPDAAHAWDGRSLP